MEPLFTIQITVAQDKGIRKLCEEAWRLADELNVNVEFKYQGLTVFLTNKTASIEDAIIRFNQMKEKLEYISEQGEYNEGGTP